MIMSHRLRQSLHQECTPDRGSPILHGAAPVEKRPCMCVAPLAAGC